MADPEVARLPLVQRLALSYTPRKARESAALLLLLDSRLAGILRTTGEPVLAQIKLAWWRDRLRESPDAWPRGEPLLAALAEWPADISGLSALVDGWEALLAEELTPERIELFAEGRATAWAMLASTADRPVVLQAAREWALADLALNLGKAREAETARQLALAMTGSRANRLPRPFRALAVMRALALRALTDNRREYIDGPGALGLALRIGLFGR